MLLPHYILEGLGAILVVQRECHGCRLFLEGLLKTGFMVLLCYSSRYFFFSYILANQY